MINVMKKCIRAIISLLTNYIFYLVIMVMDLYLLLGAIAEELSYAKAYYFIHYPIFTILYVGFMLLHVVCAVIVLVQKIIPNAKQKFRRLFIALFGVTLCMTVLISASVFFMYPRSENLFSGYSLVWALHVSCVVKIYYMIVSNVNLMGKPVWRKWLLSATTVIVLGEAYLVGSVLCSEYIIPGSYVSDKISEYMSYREEQKKSADIVEFGEYNQNNTTYGKQKIEWQVLDVVDGKALLLSKCLLDVKTYHDVKEDVTWETCKLREWLNSEFIETAFTPEEAEKILVTHVTADVNPKCDVDPGKDTEDRIFLLSITEAEKYAENKNVIVCESTKYAADQRCSGWWWLRSPGYKENAAASVRDDGTIHYYGNNVDYEKYGVRPALWVKAELLDLDD